MNSLIVAVFAVVLAVANAGLIAHGHGVVLQGPSTKTALVGPDGSHISAHAPGGQVAHSVDVGYAAHTGHVAPVVVAHGVHAPVVAHVAPAVVAHTHALPLTAHYEHVAPVVAHATHATPIIAHAVPIAAPAVAHSSISRVDQIHSAPVVSHITIPAAAPVHLTHGHEEGQYVHDYTETHYDDGSYKGEGYHH